MTSMATLPPGTVNRTIILGPRELQILRLLWARGPATGRTLHTWLAGGELLPYTTVMSACRKLIARGLITYRPATADELRNRTGSPNIYAPAIDEAAFVRADAGYQDYVIALYSPHEAAPTCASDDDITHLRDRAERAERAAEAWEAACHRAEQRIAALERRAQEAEDQLASAEWKVATLERQLNRSPRAERPSRPPLGVIIEHRDPAGICRVCRAPAPPPHGLRSDDLRVCVASECRKEARRRDNMARQQRYNARQKAKATH